MQFVYTIEVKFIIKEIKNNREYEGRFGKHIIYTMELEDDDGIIETVDMFQKPETEAPKAGDSLEGELEDTPFGKRLKKIRPLSTKIERAEIEKGRIYWDKRKQILISRIGFLNSMISYHALKGDKPTLDQLFSEADKALKWMVGKSEPLDDE